MKLLNIVCQTIVLIIFISRQTLSTQYESETEFLINWVSYVDNIKTLESFSRFNRENSNIQSSTELESLNNDKEKINEYLHNSINDKINDLNCTYAHNAKFHLDSMHMILDTDLLSEIKFNVAEKLKSLYLNVTMKAFFTFFNFNIEPPEWMWTFITYLQKEYNPKKFPYNLHNITIILKQVTTSTVCRRTKVSWSSFSYHPLLIVSDRNFKAMDLTELQEEILYLNNLKIWCSINNSSDRDLDILSSNQNQRATTIKMPKIYKLQTLAQITMDIKYNIILGIHFVLQQNKSILSYVQKKEFNDLLIIKKNKKTKKIVEYCNNFKLRIPREYTIYNEEFKAIHTYICQRCSLLNIDANFYLINKKMLVNTMQTQFYIEPYLDDYRKLFGMFNEISNTIIDDVVCTYAHHALIHMTETVWILRQISLMPDEKTNNKNSNIELISRYFDVSVRALATLLNLNYQPPGWMTLIVLYFEKFSDLYDHMKILLAETAIIDTLLRKVCKICNVEQKTLPIHDIPLEKVSTDYKYNNVELYRRWQREMTLIQIKQPIRSNYVSKMYSNLMQIDFLLNLNSHILKYSNYKKYYPSKWLYSDVKFTKEIVETLRWDFEKNNLLAWHGDVVKLLNNIESTNVEVENIGKKRMDKSNDIGKTFLSFVAAAMVRLIASFVQQCYYIRMSTLFNSEIIKNTYATSCSNMAVHITELVEISGLVYQKGFRTLAVELSDYERWNLQVTTIDKKKYNDKLIAYNLYVKCLIKLQEISTNNRMNANIPVLGISKVSEENLPKIWNRIENLKEIAKNYVLNFKTNFQGFIDNWYMHNVLINSADSLLTNIYKDPTVSFSSILTRKFGNNAIPSRSEEGPIH